ncbi:hypothetical protein GOP47_0025311 [Adiantum capillus-veneris]|uniref:Uncharacterized protein n=1 Tax=Adiantum capillus-veneris TaxID=13818 RepID=A0A9D4U0T1_ADICA|nr:hypothetical protein GOP47_0025311 [Adiantum capillus-veneris]
MLVYDIQITKERESRLTQLKQGMPVEDVKKEEKSIHREIIHKYQERIGKNKIQWVSLLESDGITRTTFGLNKGDNFFRHWLRREGYLARVYERATQLVLDNSNLPGGAPLPHECTLGFYFDEIKFEARPFLYPLEVSLEAKSKYVEKQALKKVDTFRMAAQRLAYRFLSLLVSKGILPTLPFVGHTLEREKELRETMLRDAAAEARQPPPATSKARQPGVHLSSERMETVVDTTIEKDVLEHDSSGLIVVRRSIQFVYVLEFWMAAHYGFYCRRGYWMGGEVGRDSQMVVHRRIIVLHHSSYGYVESLSDRIQCQCSMLLMRSREEVSTSLDVEDEGDMPSRVDPYDD